MHDENEATMEFGASSVCVGGVLAHSLRFIERV